MQIVKYISFEQNLYYETNRIKEQEIFNIDTIFNSIPLTKCLAIIQVFDEPTTINIAYNQSNNICERYMINPNETAYLQLNNPNNVFILLKGDYKLKLKAYRLRIN